MRSFFRFCALCLWLSSSISAAAVITPTNNFFPYPGGGAGSLGTGGNGQVLVTAPAGTTWTATPNVAWLSIVSGASGSGNGIVVFSVAANPGSAQRVGSITIAGQTFTVTQLGPPPATGGVLIVEYYDAVDDDYFITADPAEQQTLNAAALAGAVWSRTGMTFNSGGDASVYRFIYRSSSGVNTHFYTLNTAEQSSLLANNPIWVLESPVAFYMKAANPNQTCPSGYVPVYRAAQEQTGSHRFTTQQNAINEVLARGWTSEGIAMCAPSGTAGGSDPPPGPGEETVTGKVIDGYIAAAVVCADLDANGRCDEDEPQTRTDSAGSYQLVIPKGFTGPLVAEVIAGQSRDSDLPGTTVDVSYRMASPSKDYSTNITPFSTLVHLSAEKNFPLAEDLVRNELGLPPKFAIHLDSAAAPGSLTQAVAKAVVAALKATVTTLDFQAVGALDMVIGALPHTLTDLPVLQISTKNGVPIQSKQIYVDATFSLTNPAVSDQAVKLNGQIRGRGNSTWGQPKNPYHIKLTDDANYANMADFLGMPADRHWNLLADYFDRSLLRNKLALSLGNSSVFSDGLKWTPSGQHIEVYLNDDYVGVYLLAESIRIGPARLNIKEMSADPAVNDIDGGYIVEVDVRLDCYNIEPINLQQHTFQGVPVCQDTPDETAITVSQLSFSKNLLNQTEQDISGRGSLEKINPASFADWYLLQELFRNNDAAFYSSDYMWKDTDAAVNPLDRVMNMGPIWDFDGSAGNVNINDNWNTDGCWVSKTQTWSPNWITRLFDNPEFLNLTLARWKQKRPALEKFINSSIDTYARRLDQPEQRNFARWPIFGVPLSINGFYMFSNYGDEVAFLKSFLNQRMAWLDKAYASPESFNALCK
jgi:hypothetical protein